MRSFLIPDTEVRYSLLHYLLLLLYSKIFFPENADVHIYALDTSYCMGFILILSLGL